MLSFLIAAAYWSLVILVAMGAVIFLAFVALVVDDLLNGPPARHRRQQRARRVTDLDVASVSLYPERMRNVHAELATKSAAPALGGRARRQTRSGGNPDERHHAA